MSKSKARNILRGRLLIKIRKYVPCMEITVAILILMELDTLIIDWYRIFGITMKM
jgi:hypothetical protein